MVSNVSQLRELYGQDGLETLMSSCPHQLWYPPAEMETATVMANLYGTTLKQAPQQNSASGTRRQRDSQGRPVIITNQNNATGWSGHEGLALSANEIMAWPEERVLVRIQQQNWYMFLGQRLDSREQFATLPPAGLLRLPEPRYPDPTGIRPDTLGLTPVTTGAGQENHRPPPTEPGPGDEQQGDGTGPERPGEGAL